MKISFTTFACLALGLVSTASADHKAQDRHAPPLQLAQALHVQADGLADEIDFHYSHSEWPHHQMNRISREVVRLERDLKSGHWHRVQSNLHHIDIMLHRLDARLKSSVVVHDHAGARHLGAGVKDMHDLVESLEHSLKHPEQGHIHQRRSGDDFVVGPVRFHICR